MRFWATSTEDALIFLADSLVLRELETETAGVGSSVSGALVGRLSLRRVLAKKLK